MKFKRVRRGVRQIERQLGLPSLKGIAAVRLQYALATTADDRVVHHPVPVQIEVPLKLNRRVIDRVARDRVEDISNQPIQASEEDHRDEPVSEAWGWKQSSFHWACTTR